MNYYKTEHLSHSNNYDAVDSTDQPDEGAAANRSSARIGMTMTADLTTLELRSREQWRAWLAKNHALRPGVWLVFYKRHTGVKSISYEDAVREALCFGWIDSLLKRLDDNKYALKFTPRRTTSKWSDLNRKRRAELKAAGRLTTAGLAAKPTSRTCSKTGHSRFTRVRCQSAQS